MSRYDIKYNYDTEKWLVVDIRNRNCPTGHETYERLDAVRIAKQLDRKGK
jgi:hypothetical protein